MPPHNARPYGANSLLSEVRLVFSTAYNSSAELGMKEKKLLTLGIPSSAIALPNLLYETSTFVEKDTTHT
jgi:hypothetical protein